MTHATIIKSVVTEKSSKAQESGKYTFVISPDASKVDVKQAVKEFYGADVDKVNIGIVPSKSRLLKGRYEWKKRPTYKKATVTLKKGQTLDPNKFKAKK